LSMSIILSLAGDGLPDDLLARQGYREVARISGTHTYHVRFADDGQRNRDNRAIESSPQAHTVKKAGRSDKHPNTKLFYV
jgi:hypothetical protein